MVIVQIRNLMKKKIPKLETGGTKTNRNFDASDQLCFFVH